MAPIGSPTRLTTAIPARFREERDRVLLILRRWEAEVGAHTLSPQHDAAGRP